MAAMAAAIFGSIRTVTENRRWPGGWRGAKPAAGPRELAAGHAFAQNMCRGSCELAAGIPPRRRLAPASGQLAAAI